MDQQLAPASGPAPDGPPTGKPGTALGLANPLKQVSGFIAQPAVKRSLPLVFMVGLIAAAFLAWAMVRTPPQRILFASLSDADKAAVTQALDTAGIENSFDGAGSITVAEEEYHKARMLLASQDLPKSTPGGYAILDDLPMGISRAVEGERLRQARETELAKSIEEIDSVAEARVHLAQPESSVFVRDQESPSASVIVRLEPGRALSDSQVRSIINLVASSVPGMKPDAVTIVDQMGSLLSASSGLDESIGDQRIDYQRRIEEKYRTQLYKLLTPMVGANNFSAEIQAEVNLDQSQATSESYDKDGLIRNEQGNWTSKDSGAAAGGIPGALSNTPPTTAQVKEGTQQPANDGAAAGGDAGQPAKTSEEYARTYAHGKQVSVTQSMPGDVTRLSVAVLLRDPATGKPRSKAEIQKITDLVRAAVGYDKARGDQVTVISEAFSPSATDVSEPAWYQADWVPMAARNGTAVLIALLVLMLGVRPLSKALLKKREENEPAKLVEATAGENGQETAGEPPVSIDMLASARNYDERVNLVRGFTRDNPARAALAVRDMIQADAKG
ncbi:flagellar basal-body MS-ring/collar protein FliF [Stakelama saccharophila]|uniref:Flagellar M-ring protein n=1 Tax=Stakelama saccharophila TaxID=3075605 RepID=A0ABZ0BA07_9SPHN|nr:flagellar basal-body MS-ring/collar protein FliF [Stakelama sp. W311]WNO53693.1 flagellar basal-body MS-ring/collar protein FliF [Stakelama sp. W311]